MPGTLAWMGGTRAPPRPTGYSIAGWYEGSPPAHRLLRCPKSSSHKAASQRAAKSRPKRFSASLLRWNTLKDGEKGETDKYGASTSLSW